MSPSVSIYTFLDTPSRWSVWTGWPTHGAHVSPLAATGGACAAALACIGAAYTDGKRSLALPARQEGRLRIRSAIPLCCCHGEEGPGPEITPGDDLEGSQGAVLRAQLRGRGS